MQGYLSTGNLIAAVCSLFAHLPDLQISSPCAVIERRPQIIGKENWYGEAGSSNTPNPRA